MIPREAYLYGTGVEQITDQSGREEGYLIDLKKGKVQGTMRSIPSADGLSTIYMLVPNNGLFLAVKGATFPLKTYPDANSIFACNLVKAMIIESFKLISKWYLLPFLLFVNKQEAIDAFNRVGFKAISAHLLIDDALTRFSVEFKKLFTTFLIEFGFKEESSKMFALIFTQLIEYDNSYRLRVSDAFSETSQEALKKQKEVRRILNLMRDRETRPEGKGAAIHNKFRIFGRLLWLALFIPKVRRAWVRALDSVNYKDLQLDDNDIFWSGLRSDYLWQGKTQEERVAEGKAKGWVYPELTKRE